MEPRRGDNWIAVYLFYPEALGDVLRNIVSPLVDNVLKAQLANQFFYIRYWDDGQHIRLRFRCPNTELLNELRSFTANYCVNRTKSDSNKRDSPAMTLLERFTFHTYLPEITRYGGPHTISIAEKQFHGSSEAVLAFTKENIDDNYSEILIMAVKLHISLIRCFKFNLEETITFFEFTYQNWIQKVHNVVKHVGESQSSLQQRVVEKLNERFCSNAEMLIPFCIKCYTGGHGSNLKDTWLIEWTRKMNAIYSDFQLAAQSIEMPALYPQERIGKVPLTILDSFIHMTNNRLGVINFDEGYISYLIFQALREAKKKLQV